MRPGRAIVTLGLLVLALLVATPGAVAKQRAYFSEFGVDSEIPGFQVRDSGALSPLGVLPPTAGSEGLEGVTISPNAKRLFAVGQGDELYAYSIAGSGRLNEFDNSPRPVGADPVGVVVTPDGRFVYVAGNSDNVITGFRNRASGPRAFAGDETPNIEGPAGLAVSPDGRFLYSANPGGDSVSAYRISSDGVLNELSASPFEGVADPYAISITPNGRYLYVPSRDGAPEVFGFRIAGNGSLTELDGSPWPVGGNNPFGSTMTPDGRHYFTSNYGSLDISGFDVLPGGDLEVQTDSPYASPSGIPSALTTSVDGDALFTSSGGGDDLADVFRLDGAGIPTPLGASPFDVGVVGDYQAVALTPEQPPKAKLKVKDKRELKVRRKVKFNASRSTDDGRIVRYEWDFDDGSSRTTSRPKIKHRYDRKGRYRVSVTLTDDEGCSTKYVSGGQIAFCNGSKRAVAKQKIRIRRR